MVFHVTLQCHDTFKWSATNVMGRPNHVRPARFSKRGGKLEKPLKSVSFNFYFLFFTVPIGQCSINSIMFSVRSYDFDYFSLFYCHQIPVLCSPYSASSCIYILLSHIYQLNVSKYCILDLFINRIRDKVEAGYYYYY